MRRDEHQVVVVGAGAAGLTAARRLSERGVDVVVVEARERVGGRMVNEPIAPGAVVEMGGQWVGPTQDRVLALIAELGLETFPTPTAGDNLIELGETLRRYRGTIPKAPLLTLAELGVGRFLLGRLTRRVDPSAPWSSPGAARLDDMSLGDWIARRSRTDLTRELFALSCKTVFGAAPDDLSLLWALAYMRGGGSFEKLLDVEGGAQQDRIVGGSALIAERMASDLGDRVVLGSPVERIAWSDDGATVGSAGREWTARHVVVAVPPALVRRISFAPALPGRQAELLDALEGGNAIKVCAVYDRPFWRDHGLSGEALSTTGPVTIAFDNSPPSGSPGVLVGFVGGVDAAPYAALSPEERRSSCLGTFARLYGERALAAERFLERDWLHEEWSRGGPVANLRPGDVMRVGPALSEAAGPIRFAGTERSGIWRGYIDGAVRSGEETAAAIAL